MPPLILRLITWQRMSRSDPELLKARPIVVSIRTGSKMVIAGNMRVRACRHLGYATVPAVQVNLTGEQEKRWALKDNIHQGQWDYDLLVNFADQLFDAPGIDLADMLRGDSGEAATTEDGKCTRCEELRDQWLRTQDLLAQKALCEPIQRQAFIDVPYIPLGQMISPTAHRSDLTGMLQGSVPVFCNMARA